MAEVAKLLRVSRKTVEKLIYAKKLHAVKVGRVWRIPRAAVEAFLEGKEFKIGTKTSPPSPTQRQPPTKRK